MIFESKEEPETVPLLNSKQFQPVLPYNSIPSNISNNNENNNVNYNINDGDDSDGYMWDVCIVLPVIAISEVNIYILL